MMVATRQTNKIFSHLSSLAELRSVRKNFEVAVLHWRDDASWTHKTLRKKLRGHCQNKPPCPTALDNSIQATPNPLSFRYFKTGSEIVQLAVMLYERFPLLLRKLENLLHERDVKVRSESVW